MPHVESTARTGIVPGCLFGFESNFLHFIAFPPKKVDDSRMPELVQATLFSMGGLYCVVARAFGHRMHRPSTNPESSKLGASTIMKVRSAWRFLLHLATSELFASICLRICFPCWF